MGEKGNVRSYVDRGRQLRRCSDVELFSFYKSGLTRWADGMLDTRLLYDADAEFKLRAVAIPFDEECRQIVVQALKKAGI